MTKILKKYRQIILDYRNLYDQMANKTFLQSYFKKILMLKKVTNKTLIDYLKNPNKEHNNFTIEPELTFLEQGENMIFPFKKGSGYNINELNQKVLKGQNLIKFLNTLPDEKYKTIEFNLKVYNELLHLKLRYFNINIEEINEKFKNFEIAGNFSEILKK